MSTFFCIATSAILLIFLKYAFPFLFAHPLVVVVLIAFPFIVPRLTSSYSKAALGEFFAAFVLLAALPSYVFDVSSGPPESGRNIIVLLLFLAVLMGVLSYLLSDSFREWLHEKVLWDRVHFVLTILYGGVFALAACYLYYQFAIGHHDTGTFLQALWSGSQGEGFYTSGIPAETTLNSAFRYHTKLTIFFLAPIYKLLPSAFTLYVINSYSIALAAFPLYWLSRDAIGKPAAFLLCFSFLTAPYIIGMHVEEILFETLGIPFIFLTFYYFEKNQFKPFLVCALLAMTPKEDLSLCIAMFGIYAFLRKRSARWIWTPLLVGLGWFYIAVFVIIAHFNQGDLPWNLTVSYGVFGKTAKEIIQNILWNPVLVFKTLFTVKKLQYFWIIFSSMGLMTPFLTSAWIIFLPLLIKTGLLGSYLMNSGVVHSEVRPWYATPIVVFGYAAVVYALKKLLAKRPSHKWMKDLIYLFLFIQLMVNIASYPFWTHLARKEQTNDFPSTYLQTLRKIIHRIPENASVVVPNYLYARLHQRKYIYSARFKETSAKIEEGVDFVVLDEKGPLHPGILRVKDNPRYELILKDRTLSLYKHRKN